MKIAIPYRDGRISPVFDVAENLLLVEVTGQMEQQRTKVTLTSCSDHERVREITQLGTDVLICGVLSKELNTALNSKGVQVIPHQCGNIEKVLSAFINGNLKQGDFLMPGCRKI